MLLSASERRALVQSFDDLISEMEAFLDPGFDREPIEAQVLLERSGQPGRPRHVIDVQRAIELYNVGNSWADIAKVLNTSRRRIFDRIGAIPPAERPYIRHLDPIPDEELDEMIRTERARAPYIGAVIMQGRFRAQGVHIAVKRIYERMRRMEPIAVVQR